MDCLCRPRGSIHLILGPMFSGKTTELFRLTRRHTLAKKKVMVLKYARDTRYDSTMACTHDLNKMEAISALKLADVISMLDDVDVVGIDEGQFFEDVVQYSQELANRGKIIIIAALNGDYLQKPFQNIATLISFAERIEKLSAVCRCGHSASFTFRNVQCQKREVIGGEDLYQAVCRDCYIRLAENCAENGGENVLPPSFNNLHYHYHKSVAPLSVINSSLEKNGKIIGQNMNGGETDVSMVNVGGGAGDYGNNNGNANGLSLIALRKG